MLVTGAGGFIGSHVTQRLVQLGATTRAFVRYTSSGAAGWLDSADVHDHVEVIRGDISDAETVTPALKNVEVVFHLAALVAIPYSYRAPRSYVRTNIEGTLNVLEAARASGVERVVHTSTSETYGTAQRIPIDEAHPLRGQSPYAASKIGADMMAEAYHRSYGLPVTILRPFNAFGPRQSARAVVPTIVTQALTKTQIHLGNLAPTRDLTYVDDTVEAFLRAATCADAIGRVVNAGSGREVSVAELATLVCELTGSAATVVADADRMRPEASEVDRLCADSALARELLGWEPQVSLEEGLRRTIAWIEENLDHYRPDQYAT